MLFGLLDLADCLIDLADRLPVTKVRDQQPDAGYTRRQWIAIVNQLEYQTSKSGPDDLGHRAREAVLLPGRPYIASIFERLKYSRGGKRKKDLHQSQAAERGDRVLFFPAVKAKWSIRHDR